VIKSISPLIASLKEYKRSSFNSDIIAGLTVGIILIPQALAYALLAGVPPIYGLYSALIPMLIYALLGSSYYLSIGPVAITAILMLKSVSKIHTPFSEPYIQLIILLGLFIGVFQIILGALRMGQLTQYIPKTVLSGFIQAAAILIIFSQFKDALGLMIPSQLSTFETLFYVINHAIEINLLALGLFGFSLLTILLVNSRNKRFPVALVVVLTSIGMSYYFQLDNKGLQIVGDIPQGFPELIFPVYEISTFISLIPSIFAVTFIGYVGSIGLALSFEHLQEEKVNANKELFVLGLAKVVGAFFQAFPSTGSFSRTAINVTAGAKTQISSLITIILLAVTLLFITPLFYYLPNAVLAAIIVHSVFSLLKVDYVKELWGKNKIDFTVFTATFMLTILTSLEIGVIGGILFYYLLTYSIHLFFNNNKS